jgi:hypothetical protein
LTASVGDQPTTGGGAGGASPHPGGMLHKYRLLEAFKNKKEREDLVRSLPNATERERVVLRKSAKKLIAREPANYKEIEQRVSEDLQSIGLSPAPSHLDWLLYFLRAEAQALEDARRAEQSDEEIMTTLLMAMME